MFGRIKRFLKQNTTYGKTRYLNFLYRYDLNRYFKYSATNRSDAASIATEIRLLVHALEKGLSNKVPKQGFGEEKARLLLKLMDSYRASCDDPDPQVLLLAESTLHSYSTYKNSCNEALSFLPDTLKSSIPAGATLYSGTDMREFEVIARTRHSIREFSDIPVSRESLTQAISLAQTAPSACNRQPCHVFACLNKEKNKKIMARHGGTSGFTDPGAILVLTGDLVLYKGEYERNLVFFDGGIFMMNLLYSLGCYNLASCPIIWGAEPDNDSFLYDLLNIPPQHEILGLVMVGNHPDHPVKIPVSYKRDTRDILHFIDNHT